MAALRRGDLARARVLSAGFVGSLSRRVGEPGWLILALAVYLAQDFAITRLAQDGGEAILRRILFLTTTMLVVVLTFHFRRYLGAWLVAAGILMNAGMMAAHGGLMPVAWETVRDSGAFPEVTATDIGRQVPNSKDIVLWRDDIRFQPLSDQFVITVPGYGANIYSAGDGVVLVGLVLTVVQVVASFALPARRRPDPSLAT